MLNRFRTIILPCLALCFATFSAMAAPARISDNGDGTYTNPILYADYPDPDIIRVGNDFYMVSTSFVSMPGMQLMRSKDLINWGVVSSALETIDLEPRYSLIGGNHYSQGMWAASLRYHNGTFYILDNLQGVGAIVCRATKPEGPWKMNSLNRYLHDPGLMFDDDGTPIVYNGANGQISVAFLDKELTKVVSSQPVYKLRTGEGSHAYKVGDTYYVFNAVFGEYPILLCSRSKSRTGPFETTVVCNNRRPWSSPHQGGMVQLQNGSWWGFSLVDSGPVGRTLWGGRINWKDGWPYFGNPDAPSIPETGNKPDVGAQYPAQPLPTSDDFSNPNLGTQWQWNHNPDNAKWSLQERNGFLRLKTQTAPNLSNARNTLTQRTWGPQCVGTVKIDISNLQEGDRAGLALFQARFGYLAVYKEKGTANLVRVENQNRKLDAPSEDILDTVNDIKATTLWLRANCDFITKRAQFSYSLDGVTFIPVGVTIEMQFTLDTFQGVRLAIFNYNPTPSNSWLDVDSFELD